MKRTRRKKPVILFKGGGGAMTEFSLYYNVTEGYEHLILQNLSHKYLFSKHYENLNSYFTGKFPDSLT